MGEIYTQAKEVISWHGNSKALARELNPDVMPSADGGAAFAWTSHWSRAWIIREIALAQRVTLVAGCHEGDLSITRARLPRWKKSREDDASSSAFDLMQWAKCRGTSLIELLEKINEKECGDWQDKMYSLLALCGDKNIVEVDYDIGRADLMAQVLGASKCRLCLCSVAVIAKAVFLWRFREGPKGCDTISKRAAPRYEVIHMVQKTVCRIEGSRCKGCSFISS